MEFVVNREQFVKVLHNAAGVASKPSQTPILNNLLLEANGNSVKVAVTDRQIGL